MSDSPTNIEDVKRRAGKYLALYADATKRGSAAEAQFAFERASFLIYEHGLDAATLGVEQESDVKVNVVRYSFWLSSKGGHGPERCSALFQIIEAYDCMGVTRGRKRDNYGQPIEFEVIGPDDVVEMLKMVIPALLIQMEVSSKQAVRALREELYYLDAREVNAMAIDRKRAHIAGYGIGVARKLTERLQKKQAENKGTGMELVLVGRSEKVAQVFKETYPKLRTPRPARKRMDRDGLISGIRAGRAADLGDRSIGNDRKSIQS